MYTPYDWQEGIGNRAQYIEGKLAHGSPVLAVSLDRGIVLFTYRRQARKIYEIYDRLAFAGMGQQSDVESLRLASLEFASKEGYNRSEEDVTIQRVATAISSGVKKAFGDFTGSPLVVRSLFAEIGETPTDDLYYAIDYDGDYEMFRMAATLGSTAEAAAESCKKVCEIDSSSSVEETLASLTEIWNGARDDSEGGEPLKPEGLLVERHPVHENRFKLLYPEEF